MVDLEDLVGTRRVGMRGYLREDPSVGRRPASPTANHMASQQSMGIDKEWDFDIRSPPTPRDDLCVGRSRDRIKTQAAQARVVSIAKGRR